MISELEYTVWVLGLQERIQWIEAQLNLKDYEIAGLKKAVGIYKRQNADLRTRIQI
jgi:hypothetical protein